MNEISKILGVIPYNIQESRYAMVLFLRFNLFYSFIIFFIFICIKCSVNLCIELFKVVSKLSICDKLLFQIWVFFFLSLEITLRFWERDLIGSRIPCD